MNCDFCHREIESYEPTYYVCHYGVVCQECYDNYDPWEEVDRAYNDWKDEF